MSVLLDPGQGWPGGYGQPGTPAPSGASPAIPDPAAAGLLMALRDCVCEQMTHTLYGPVCRCYVAWGPALPIQDGCSCTCGLEGEHNGDAWVKLDSLEPDLSATSGSPGMAWCAPAWTATMSMGVYRCIPVAESEDVMPAEQVTDISLALLSDMAALWRVLSCCPQALDNGVRVVAWTPIDPSGGCAGGSLTIQIPLSGTGSSVCSP
jgi:hypothetical protein